MNYSSLAIDRFMWAYSFANMEGLIITVVITLIIIAVLFYIVMFIRDSAKQETFSQISHEQLLNNFEKIYEDGELTNEEYRQIKRLLTAQLVEELQEKEIQKKKQLSAGKTGIANSETLLRQLLAPSEKKD